MLKLVVLLALLTGCYASTDVSHGKVGALSSDLNWVTTNNIPTITGTNATIVLFQMNGGRSTLANGAVNRILVSLRCDQPITLLYQVERNGGGSIWRTMNGWNSGDPIQGHPSGCTDASPGRGLGDTVSASTDTTCDYLVLGPNSRLEAMTGATPPTACETDIGLFVDRPPGM